MRRAVADRRASPGGLSGVGLRDLLSSGIAGLESVPAVRPDAPSAPSARRPTPPGLPGTRAAITHQAPAALPPIDQFLYRGSTALAAARALAARLAQTSQPPAPADLEELHDLLRLADEG